MCVILPLIHAGDVQLILIYKLILTNFRFFLTEKLLKWCHNVPVRITIFMTTIVKLHFTHNLYKEIVKWIWIWGVKCDLDILSEIHAFI